MWLGFGDQYSFFTRPPMNWAGPVASMFIILNMLMQVGGSLAIISGKGLFIDIVCTSLLSLSLVLSMFCAGDMLAFVPVR